MGAKQLINGWFHFLRFGWIKPLGTRSCTKQRCGKERYNSGSYFGSTGRSNLKILEMH